ncbi:MAG: hypothetical protein P1V51_00530 [Deltaproteobacteria bacterium]|nr:hypothetical protein [Deltaproteobacteria bacterium]
MKRAWMGVFALGLAGCGLLGHPDDGPGDGPAANVVRFTLDGQSVEILEELAYAVHDQTRDLLGPNTELFLEAGSPATVPDRILGPKLQVNLPAGTTPGTYRLSYALFPSSRGPWVRFRESETRSWTAHDGELTVQEVGAVGGRMRLTFDELRLTSDCGDERVLSAGTLDVAVGAETVFPDQEIEELTIDPADAARIGNTVTLVLSGRRWVCLTEQVELETYPASQSSTGAPADSLGVQAFCACGTAPDEATWVGFFVPPGTVGEVTVGGAPYNLFVGIDEGTPLNLTDDPIYRVTTPTRLRYSGPAEGAGSDVDIESAAAILLSHFDPATGTTDTTRNVVMGEMRFSGRVEVDCRPDRCP